MDKEIKNSMIFWNIILLAIQIWLGYYFGFIYLVLLQIIQLVVVIINEGSDVADYIWLSSIIILVLLIIYVIVEISHIPKIVKIIFDYIKNSITKFNNFIDNHKSN